MLCFKGCGFWNTESKPKYVHDFIQEPKKDKLLGDNF